MNMNFCEKKERESHSFPAPLSQSHRVFVGTFTKNIQKISDIFPHKTVAEE